MPEWSGDGSVRGLRAVVLENWRLRVVVLPGLGGRIWSVRLKPLDRELLWHHPRRAPRPAPFGACFDDWFAGGWDELFPNDAPAVLDGEPLPDHGEWWALPSDWRVEERSGAVVLRLSGAGVVTQHHWERTIELRGDEPTLRLATTIRNQGVRPLPFLWRTHPALPVAPGARIELPADRVTVDPAFSPGLEPGPFAWPLARTTGGDTVDLSVCPEPGPDRALLAYATGLRAGWCALTGADGAGVGFAFDPAAIDTVTLFASFGGWHGLETVVLEPGVGWPYDLDAARANGSAGTLEPGGTATFDVAMVAYEGMSRIDAISPEGEVLGR